jgi:hypothetical protein
MNIERLPSILATGIALVTLLTSSAIAQQTKTVASVTFKEGQVLVPENGNVVAPTNDVSLPGDILVKTNGGFTVKKGKQRQLLEGQTITADGLITSPDGSVMPVFDHLVSRGGQVYLVKDGDSLPISREFTLPDSSRVAADGTIMGRDGRLRRMLDGQIFKLDGTGLPATDTASLQNGKVVLFKDGGHVELRRGQWMAMSDNTRVNGDGYLIRPDGTRITLKEGEIVKLPGVIAPRRR